MTPEDLAARHPRLYHLTTPESVEGIRRHGLLTTRALLDLYEADAATRARVLARRPTEMALARPGLPLAVVNDNRPLSDARLRACLDDGLSPDDWRAMLNDRAFLWPDDRGLATLAGARMNRDRPRAVLVVDTLSLARAHAARMEISPINSGATIHRPARRGLDTFAPLLGTDWDAWRRRRGRAAPDRIKEVTVRGGIPDIAAHVLDVRAP